MGKPALGKGLGQLMGGRPVPRGSLAPKSAGPADTPATAKVTPVDFGRGLNTLVTPRPDKEEAPQKRPLLPPWFFFTADLLLLAFTVAICLDADKPMDFGEVVFGAVSTALGGLLAIAGVLRATD